MPPRARSGPSSPGPANPALALHETRHRYTPESTATKHTLLQHLLATPPATQKDVVRLHDDLLFLRAFPDNAEVATLARRGLDGSIRWLRRAARRASGDDSGIASSTSRHTFPYAIARWLVRRHGADVSIDWRAIDDTTHLDALLRTFLTRAEEDAFDNGDLSTRDWMRLALPERSPTDLVWVITNGDARLRLRGAFAALYDVASLPVAWRLGGSRGSTTRNELRDCRVQYRRGMREMPSAPIRHVGTPLARVELLPKRRAEQVIDVARAALTARCREVFAISNPNPAEVWLADLGAGASLAIIGTEPSLRMSLESNYGYLLVSNGVPIGYGGVTPLWMQANTGINIFDPFRGSEASFLWAQTLRAFHTLFGVRRFLINGYQFGEGNSEAISSGAFWFYYRLGFRPSDPDTRRLAAKESRQLHRDRSYRSPSSVLRALARGDLHLTLPGYREDTFIDETLLAVCASQVTARLAAQASSLRAVTVDACVDRVLHALRVRSRARWPRAEREAFDRLAPVLDLVPALSTWSDRDRDALIRLARSKGGEQERDFVLLSQQHDRFWRVLRRLLTARRPPL